MPVREWLERNKAEAPWITPWDWARAETKQWDMDHANWTELNAKEPDTDRFLQAVDLSDEGEFERANSIWLDLAETGSIRSMVELGLAYEYGLGVVLDHDQSEAWYQRASANGSTYAMVKCAQFELARRNFPNAYEQLRPGVQQQCPSAQFWQAYIEVKENECRQTYRKIRPLLQSAARKGHPYGKAWLANLMVRGKFGLIWVLFGLAQVIRLGITKTNQYRPNEES